jgi:hypothetical protein
MMSTNQAKNQARRVSDAKKLPSLNKPTNPQEKDEPQEEEHKLEDIEGELNPRNFHNLIYEDDNFKDMKLEMANDSIKAEQFRTEKLDLMSDIDKEMAKLKDWKQERE